MMYFKPKNYPRHRLMDMSQELIWVDNARRVELSIEFKDPAFITVIAIPEGMQAVYSVYDLGVGVRDLSAYPHPKYRWVSATCIELEEPYTGVLQILRRTDVGTALPRGLNPAYEQALHITQEIIGAVRALGKPQIFTPPVPPVEPPPPPEEPPIEPQPTGKHLYVTRYMMQFWANATGLNIFSRDERANINELRTAWREFIQHLQTTHPDYELYWHYPALELYEHGGVEQPSGTVHSQTRKAYGYAVRYVTSTAPVDVIVVQRDTYDVPHEATQSSTGLWFKRAGEYKQHQYWFVWHADNPNDVFIIPENLYYEPQSIVDLNPTYSAAEPREDMLANDTTWIYWVSTGKWYEGYWKMRYYIPPYSLEGSYGFHTEVSNVELANTYGDYNGSYWYAKARFEKVVRNVVLYLESSVTPISQPARFPVVPQYGAATRTRQEAYAVHTGYGSTTINDVLPLNSTGNGIAASIAEHDIDWNAVYLQNPVILESRAVSGDAWQTLPRLSIDAQDAPKPTWRLGYISNTLQGHTQDLWFWRQHHLEANQQDTHTKVSRVVATEGQGVTYLLGFDTINVELPN